MTEYEKLGSGAREDAAAPARITVVYVEGHEGKAVAAPCCLDGCQYGTVEAQLAARDAALQACQEERDFYATILTPDGLLRGESPLAREIVTQSREATVAALSDTLHALHALEAGVQLVVDTFATDEAQGYRSADRQFAISILGRDLARLRAILAPQEPPP